MALEKKDVRTWLSPEAHAVLQALADLHEAKSDADYASQVLEEALLGKVHSARLLLERMARFGKTRSLPDIPGIFRKGPSGRGGE